jgi:DNA polymerase III subunit epsilon
MTGRELCREWLRQKAYFLDTETTGLDEQAEIVEIAVIDSAGDLVYEALLRPQQPIPPRVIAIHGITDTMVADAPLFWECHQQLNDLLAGKLLIAYGAGFDARMLEQTCLRYNLPQITSDWGCAMEMYQAHIGREKRVSLADATRQCKVYNRQVHRARTDAEATLGVVNAVAGYRL